MYAALLPLPSQLQQINWQRLLKKEYPAPFVPEVAGEMDTQNFAEEFTSQKPVDSPAEEPQNYGELFRVSKMGIYTQYSVWALVTNGGNHWVFCGSKALVQSLTTGGQSVVTFWVQDEREWRGRGRRGGGRGRRER